MSRASEAFAALQYGMQAIDPACQDDERFVSDDQLAAELAPICAVCPLFHLCAEYAQLERPKGGIWAGKRYVQYRTSPGAQK